MIVPYINRFGQDTTLLAPIQTSYNPNTVSSHITEIGYQYIPLLNDYQSYGTVKWCDTVYTGNDPHDTFFPDMLDVEFQFDYGFTAGTVTISGNIMCGDDLRQYRVTPNPASFSQTLTIIVGYMRGDVNGDGSLTIDDVTALINYMLNPEAAGWDQYQIAAGDVNGSGSITIADVTALTNLLLQNGNTNSEELLDLQSLIMDLQMNGGGQGGYYAPCTPSGIGELTALTHPAVDPNYYNLMGQPVGTEVPSTPGIYIHQGKKICVR